MFCALAIRANICYLLALCVSTPLEGKRFWLLGCPGHVAMGVLFSLLVFQFNWGSGQLVIRCLYSRCCLSVADSVADSSFSQSGWVWSAVILWRSKGVMKHTRAWLSLDAGDHYNAHTTNTCHMKTSLTSWGGSLCCVFVSKVDKSAFIGCVKGSVCRIQWHLVVKLHVAPHPPRSNTIENLWKPSVVIKNVSSVRWLLCYFVLC